MELIKRVRCEEGEIYASHPFLVKDVLFSAILVRANEALLEIAEVVGASEEERSAARGWIERGLRGLEGCWNPELGLCLDYDVRAAEPLPARTVGGFAPLIAGTKSPDHLKAILGSSARPTSPGTRGYAGRCRPAPAQETPSSILAGTGAGPPSTGSCGGL